ncbi:hypothetical protein DFJ58DRAFT_726361 [Suillus subalutaceus]|uniref:uncharacterized protein n=1 Tax=Suillus subalutaceus TaxID=48586 RepID=UPI001B8771DA|nr:uncharacterized protein DFJ58DRAFT_726361 [Suillus subalutaceus]KAG1859333.1 hypothetical protein DFJ58DRAFT_726361 [Suillus subalutaceus]
MGTVQFSPDSKKLAAKSSVGRLLEVWNVQSWTLDHLDTVGTPFRGHTHTVTCLALSFDEALLASASFDNTIKLWDCEFHQLLTSFDIQKISTLVLSPNSSRLAYMTYANDDHEIYICDTSLDVLTQASSSTVGSWSSQLCPNHRELLPSSSHSHTVFSARNDEPHDLPPEAILQNLTGYITKDEDYPTAHGGIGEIWKCTYHIDRRSIKVTVKALQAYTTDQLGAAKAKKIKRIKHELRICANLNHPDILHVFGYTNGFGPFIAIVSPWAENGNLTVYMERKGVALTLIRRFQLASHLFMYFG